MIHDKTIKVCSNCVMDTTDKKIRFNEKGVCDHCQTFYEKILPNWHTGLEGEKQLDSIIDKIKKSGSGKDFDCIIGISGGADSSYLAYLAKEEFNLKPLVFHVDAGWNSQIAVNNIEKLVDGLNLDLFTKVIDWNEMRDLQLSYFKSGVPHIDTPQDHSFFATMYHFANKHNVKYILTGANYSTECIRNPIDWMYYQSDSKQLKDIHKKFGSIDIKNFPTTNILWHKVYLSYYKKIKVVNPLNYVDYHKENAMKLLEKKFGWMSYPQKHFESRFTRFYESYWLPQRFGFDTRKVQLSSLILTEQLTRDEAIEILLKPIFDEETIIHDFEFVANKLNISADKLKSYFELPIKSFKDYKSNYMLYKIGSFFMKLFKLELGGKR